MKQLMKTALLCTCMLPSLGFAQEPDVNRSLYPDYSTDLTPDYGLLAPKSILGKAAAEPLPDHVNNSELKFFPPVFNQSGGSCGSASRICYIFTHEINSYRNANGKLLENRYPSHFTWLLTNGNSGKHKIAIHNGVPNAEVYGGTTFSSLFGPQDMASTDYGWMQGYEKWYSAMWNRMEEITKFPLNVSTPEGREAVKRWLYNHNGDSDFYGGGIVGVGVATKAMRHTPIGKTPTNDEIGVTGKVYVENWGPQVDHALTIVGYDDRIEFDLDKNGVYGEKDKDEVGAWIIVNSWGAKWANNGFTYCPYKHSVPSFKDENSLNPKNYWYPEVYKVRKNYRPLRTMKIKMDYSRRSEISLSAGISSDLNATEPEATTKFEHFQYAGDGKRGSINPAPEVPMLGRWADGQLHHEPMEFGYDLTDLSAGFDKSQPLKYFFIIECKDWAQGQGHVYNTSIIDYEFDKMGVETPFNLPAEGVQIQNQGNRTIISAIVYGESYYAPSNLAFNGKQLVWNAPLRSAHPIKGYKLYHNGVTLAEMGTDKLSYDLAEGTFDGNYSVSALYEDGVESEKVSLSSPVVKPTVNQVADFKHSGFCIPNVFNAKYQEATIEFWIKPNSLVNYNQSAGPGWGNFMFHSNSNGGISVGWSTGNDRIELNRKLVVGRWNHIAITVKKNVLKLFIDGRQVSAITSKKYSGIGGFGDFVFTADGDNNNIDACFDEIRIWNIEKTYKELPTSKNTEYDGAVMPRGLIAYYKGDVFESNGKNYLRENISGNHAEILNDKFQQHIDTRLKFKAPEGDMALDITKPNGTILAGQLVNFEAVYSENINKLSWTAEGANVKDLQTTCPQLIFKEAGEHTVSVTGYNAQGESISDSCKITVEAAPAPDATFTTSTTTISAGERVSFLVKQPMLGYLYEWNLPGADIEKSQSMNCAATYAEKGQYEVSLTVTSPNGEKASSKQTIEVVEVAPEAKFDVAPSVIVKGETTFLKDQSKYTPTEWKWMIDGSHTDVIINGQNSSFTPKDPGIYDITLTAKNNKGSNSFTRQRALVVCNADSKNGLNFSHENAHVELTTSPFVNRTNRVTIEWWMNPTNLTANCCGIGEKGTLLFEASTDGTATLHAGVKKVNTQPGFVIANEWHHYAVIFNYGNAKFYRDGQEISNLSMGTAFIPAMNTFSIGCEEAPMSGTIDEFRIWRTALNIDKLHSYINAPIADIAKAVETDRLSVYYDCNQDGGDVIDRTGNDNHGVRVSFGPDGDAWGLSKGVFSLNLEKGQANNVTAKYLKNYRKAFKRDGKKLVNPTQAPRFGAISDWILENAEQNGDITTSVHVDNKKEGCFTFTSIWDGFGELVNHKAYQTVTLPAGSYVFSTTYGKSDNGCGNTYLVVNAGNKLVDNSSLNNAIAYQKMRNADKNASVNELRFVLAEETEVAIGLLINLSGKKCCTISEFKLESSDVEILEADNANGYDLTIDASGYNTLYLPYPSVIPENVTAYVAKEVKGEEVVLETIGEGIIPSNTGVIVSAKAGNYHFAPSEASSDLHSILVGSAKDSEAAADKRYYSLNADKEVRFDLYQSSTLQANRAYLVRGTDDTVESYKVAFVQTGIENLEGDTESTTIYDLSGRRVNEPVKGLYITNGKKVYVN